MPLDPMIARGVQVPGLGGSYLAAEEIKNRRQYNQNMMDRMAAGDQAAQAETAKAQEEQELRMLYPAVKAGDPRATQYVASKIAARNPQLGEMYTQNPALLAQALEQGLGIEAQEAPKRDIRTVGGALVEVPTEGDPRELYRPEPAPQQYAPRQPTEFELYQRDPAAYEAFKKAGRGRADEAPGASGLGLNERQQGGMNMKRDAAISYAANLAGMTREEMEAVYASEGAAGVERRMLEKGKRSVQGKKARWLQSFPLGKTFVEAENADLLPQGKAGGAGIALVQNPAGMITKADFEAGEAQFPSPAYPLENQAEMVRSILTDAERAGGKSAAATDPLAQYAGQVIKQGNKRFQVIQGADGKYFAQELK